jgi:hypothetical protein
LVLFGLVCCAWSAHSSVTSAQDCLEYGAYLHWLGDATTPGLARGVAVADGYAYVACGEAGLQIVSLADPTAPVVVGSVDTPGEAYGVAVAGGYAYVADYTAGLQVIDVSDPTLPAIVGARDTSDHAHGVALSAGGTLAYVADGADGLIVLNIASPTDPRIVGSESTEGYALGVAVLGTCAYVAASGSGLQVIDVTNATQPVLRGGVRTVDFARGVAHAAYVAASLPVGGWTSRSDQSSARYARHPGLRAGVAVAGGRVIRRQRRDCSWSTRRIHLWLLASVDTQMNSYAMALAGEIPRGERIVR